MMMRMTILMILTLSSWSCHSFIISSKTTTIVQTTARPSNLWKVVLSYHHHQHENHYDGSPKKNDGFLSLSSDDENDTTDDDDNEDDSFLTEQVKMQAVPTDTISPDTTFTTTSTTTSRTKEEQFSFLTSLGAMTGRGEFMLHTKFRPSTQQQYRAVETVVAELERINPIVAPTLSPHIYGTWELVYSTTQLFRHSPFFMAGRAVCTTDDQVQQYNWFCDMHRAALSISQIQSVRQIITHSKLISEFEINVGSVPFLSDWNPYWKYSGGLPISITGAIVSTADMTPTTEGDGWELYMDTVQIKGSNLPLIRQILDNENVALQSRTLANVLEQTISSYQTPKPIFRTTYLDEQYRISRDVDDHIFVYVKTSNATTPTDYQCVDADLGIGRLLEGFNDAVTKWYI